MNRIQPKQPRLRLDADAYQMLCRQVLERDNWRCQACGGMSNLEVHHIDFRSRGGDDSEENLITLCAACHTHRHWGSTPA
ncbi:MAG TPA: HNH endonuclease [Candidatus Bathyarchaeia archaeon]|nr:HNH endonuclease [Candidatus Bathyarchaeia archaeon]